MSEQSFPKLGEPIPSVSGRAVVVPGDDVDTDRIIPARFMKCVTFDGLGAYAFHDERFDEAGNPKGHPLDDPRFAGASVLVAGHNFGCGSSREHAPQALFRFGVRAILATSFAEIFYGNCTTLGIPCATASREDIAKIAAAVEQNPAMEIFVDVEKQEIRFAGQSVKAQVRPAARDALINGRWDPIGELLEGMPAMKDTAAKLPYLAA